MRIVRLLIIALADLRQITAICEEPAVLKYLEATCRAT